MQTHRTALVNKKIIPYNIPLCGVYGHRRRNKEEGYGYDMGRLDGL